MKAELAVERSEALQFEPLSPPRRALYIVVGTISLGLGIIGAILPAMPSTVFFLITIGCYARSSEKLYRWLLTRRWLQKPLQTALSFKRHNAVPVRIKAFAQSVAWSSFIFLVFSGRSMVAQLLGLGFAAACTIAMAVIKTMPDPRAPRAWTQHSGDVTRQLSYGALAGGLAGIVWGVAARVVLRFVANLAGVTQRFDWAALATLLAAALVFGGLAGMVYAAIRRVLPQNQWLRGGAFGMIVCFTLGIALYVGPLWQTELSRAGLGPGAGAAYQALTAALFLPNFAAFGLITSLVFGQLEKQPGAARLTL